MNALTAEPFWIHYNIHVQALDEEHSLWIINWAITGLEKQSNELDREKSDLKGQGDVGWNKMGAP